MVRVSASVGAAAGGEAHGKRRPVPRRPAGRTGWRPGTRWSSGLGAPAWTSPLRQPGGRADGLSRQRACGTKLLARPPGLPRTLSHEAGCRNIGRGAFSSRRPDGPQGL